MKMKTIIKFLLMTLFTVSVRGNSLSESLDRYLKVIEEEEVADAFKLLQDQEKALRMFHDT